MGFIKCDGLWKNSIPTILSNFKKKTKTSKQTNNNGHFASDNLDEAYRTGDSHDKLNNKEKPLNAQSLYPLKLKTLR